MYKQCHPFYTDACGAVLLEQLTFAALENKALCSHLKVLYISSLNSKAAYGLF